MVDHRVRSWEKRYPTTLRLMDKLNEHGVRWGLFFGGQIQFLPHGRQVDDHDILTDAAGFETIAGLLPGARYTVSKSVVVSGTDGHTIRYATDEVAAKLDGRTVQVMRPAPMECSNGSTYLFEMSELATRHRLWRNIGGRLLYVANPLDTALAKAAFQRRPPKQDIPDIARLAEYYNLWRDEAYVAVRAAEMGVADRRVEQCLADHAGLALGVLVSGRECVSSPCRQVALKSVL